MNKVIISDTSCLIALHKIGLLNLLKDLFPEVVITTNVKDEFGDGLPDWIFIKQVSDSAMLKDLEKILDKGEASSIVLAVETQHSTLIIDELKGRKIASTYNIEIIGTIGLLFMAYKNGLIKDVMGIVRQLVNNGFRLSNKFLSELNNKYGKK